MKIPLTSLQPVQLVSCQSWCAVVSAVHTGRKFVTEKWCCFNVRKMRYLMQKEGTAEECFTSHPGFLLPCFNKHMMKINAAAFQRMDKGQYIAKLSANKRNRYIAYSAIICLVYGWMGRGNREPLPVCVVGVIRRHFP